ncbi:MAG: hypothetical protein FD160_3771 [Caulobacteraceae bacterium]|nr:MAG: hypothetical protein FD160_3771 [Caulobacteraceae bacterium]
MSGGHLTEDEAERIVQRYRMGATIIEVASECGRTKETVRRLLVRRGVRIERRGLGGGPVARPKLTPQRLRALDVIEVERSITRQRLAEQINATYAQTAQYVTGLLDRDLVVADDARRPPTLSITEAGRAELARSIARGEQP